MRGVEVLERDDEVVVRLISDEGTVAEFSNEIAKIGDLIEERSAAAITIAAVYPHALSPEAKYFVRAVSILADLEGTQRGQAA